MAMKLKLQEGDPLFWQKLTERDILSGGQPQRFDCEYLPGKFFTIINTVDAAASPPPFLLLSDTLDQKALSTLILLCRDLMLSCGFDFEAASRHERAVLFGEFPVAAIQRHLLDNETEVTWITGHIFEASPQGDLLALAQAGAKVFVLQAQDARGEPLDSREIRACLEEVLAGNHCEHLTRVNGA
jgi:hypothetical protein